MSAPEPRIAPWEDFALRLIAIYKFAKAALFFAFGIGLRKLLHQDVSQILNDYVLEYHPDNPILNKILVWSHDHAASLTDHKIRFISYIALIYGTIFLIEGIGLYLRKHWAEYMVLLSTCLLLPIEFYETYLKLAWWKFGVILGNLLIIAYLIHRLLLDARFKAQQRAENQKKEQTPQSVPGVRSKPMVNEVS
jgi:uncharacterized membrane protein (DUF2068 family)